MDLQLFSNRLLEALPLETLGNLLPHLEPVHLELGDSVYEYGDRSSHVYFPLDALISLVYVLENGASAEYAVVGNDGIVGVTSFMAGTNPPGRAFVRNAGFALRLSAQALRQEFLRGGELQDLLLRYTQGLLTQMMQTAVCNCHHSLEKRLCRWLLLSLDRLPRHELTITQELIAAMLGVRREGVTEAAGKLQSAGVIKYARGRIVVLDRPKLEARVCECYGVVRQESERLLQLSTQGAHKKSRAIAYLAIASTISASYR